MVPGDPLCRATSLLRCLNYVEGRDGERGVGEGSGAGLKIGRRQAGRMEGSKVVRLTAGWRLVGGFKVEPGPLSWL